MKFPRPKDINFPQIQNRVNYNLIRTKEIEGSSGILQTEAKSICALKSGNILISYIWRDEKHMTIKSNLSIYSVPKLKLLEEYDFDNEVDMTIYAIDSAIQLKNGNIFAISDRLCIFDGESIAKGPKITSEEIDDKYYFSNIVCYFEKNTIRKYLNTFLCDFMFEPKEGLLLFTYTDNLNIYTLDITNLKNEIKSKFEYKKEKEGKSRKCSLDIIHHSEYYPEYLYICANSNLSSESILLIFNFDEFFETDKKKKIPQI